MHRGLLLLLLSSPLLITLISIQPASAKPPPILPPPTIQYTKTWGGSSNDTGNGVARDNGVAKDTIITGGTESFGPGNPTHTALLLLDYNSSDILRVREIWSGPGNGTDIGNGVAVDYFGNLYGNIYVTGLTTSFGAGSYDALLLKFDSTDGSLLWQRTWGGSSVDAGRGLAVDSSGNIYVTGNTYSFGAGSFDALLLKFDSTGSLVWQKTWGGSGDDDGTGVAVDSSGNIYVTGYTYSFGAGLDDVFLLKFDSAGSLLWQRTWGGYSIDAGFGVAVDSSTGNIYVTGATVNFGAGSADVMLLKFDSAGSLLWQRTWGGSSLDIGQGVAVDSSSGNIYVTGNTYSFGAGGSDVFLLKFDSTGSLLNQEIYGGSSDDAGYGVAVDSAGNAFITGYVSEAPPYSSTTTGNSTLGTPTFSLGNPYYTLGTPTAKLGTPTGSVTKPSGSQTYAGNQDVFLTKYGPTSVAALPPSLITLAGLLLIIPVILSRRRNPRVYSPLRRMACGFQTSAGDIIRRE